MDGLIQSPRDLRTLTPLQALLGAGSNKKQRSPLGEGHAPISLCWGEDSETGIREVEVAEEM